MSNLFDNEQFKKAWEGFNDGDWADEINVRDFIQQNYTPYEGDDSFLVGPTQKTKTLWNEVNDMIVEEVKSKKIKVDLERFSGINNFDAGYIDKDNEYLSEYNLTTKKPYNVHCSIGGCIVPKGSKLHIDY